MFWFYQPLMNWVLRNIVVKGLVIISYISYSLFILVTTPVHPTSISYISYSLFILVTTPVHPTSIPQATYIPKSQRYKTPHILSILLQTLVMLCHSTGQGLESWIYSLKVSHRYRQRNRRINQALYLYTLRTSVCERTPVCHQVIAMSSHSTINQTGVLPHIFDTDSALIGIDNRASACMSDNIHDFSGSLQPTNRVIRGFAGTKTTNVQIGTISWRIEDDNGKVTTHVIPNSYYVPDGKVRLLSPQHWAKMLPLHRRPSKGIAPEMTYHDRVELRWDGDTSIKTVLLDVNTNVATFTLAPDYTDYKAFWALADEDGNDDDHPFCIDAEVISDDEYESENDNEYADDDDDASIMPIPTQPRVASFHLDGPSTYTNTKAPVIIEDEEERQINSASAEFLRYHQKFNHVSPKRIQMMAQQRILPFRLSKCPVPVCTACLYGKATKRKWRSKHANNMQESYVPTRPGEVISIDQMISPTAGLVAQNTGILTKERYKVATVFIDHATDYSYVAIQRSTTADETIKAKLLFERNAYDQGIKVEAYHSDNGIFKSKAWQDNCYSNGQGLTFAGVNAHHQNGKAERRIRELQDMARTMLIHAKHRWPSAITANLWPYAVRMANDVLNSTPSSKFPDGRIPMSSFSKSNVTVNPIHWQPFGCPIYVLSAARQTTGIQNKWSERSKVGIYLGRSPQHAQSVALVLSLETGLVSPQFHVSFDPTFQTMRKQFHNKQPISQWQQKAGFIVEPTTTNMSAPNPTNAMPSHPRPPTTYRPPTISRQRDSPATAQNMDPYTSAIWDTPDANQEAVDQSIRVTTSHVSEGAQDMEPSMQDQQGPLEQIIAAMTAQVDHLCSSMGNSDPCIDLLSLESIVPEAETDQHLQHPLHAMAATNDPDTLYYHEAMKAPDKEEFLKSMYDEVQGQIDNKVYSPVLRSTVPQNIKVLPAVWIMRRKRKASTGQVYRRKSRLNIGGHKQQEGIDYDQTYSPVVTWPSIRLLLTLTLVNKWATRQIDYIQAYPQAPIERNMYMELPKGFQITDGDPDGDYVLQVHQNIYGQKQAGRVWNHYLVDHLQQVGFVQSEHDPCVFYKGKSIYILYTDDSILAGPDEQELDNIIQQMKDVGLKITSEGGIEDFLGITIERKSNGSFLLTQKRLIDSILHDLGLNRSNVLPKQTPTASSKILSKHPTSPVFDGHFHYQSVIGKLNYLEKSTRPDLAYAVHQCARFAADPRYEHGQAVKWLGRYLYGTRDKGIIFQPNKISGLNVFVDSDWSGLWDKDTAATDSSTARSRHGFIVEYCGCPLIWASQLQTEITLSSTEAEYIGLSKSLRETIPIMNILQEMKAMKYKIGITHPKVHCKVFEDNSGALEMAKVHKFRPRTKHINIKYHHFRSYVNDDSISIHPITSENNPADMLTKGLGVNKLKANRFRVMGWNVDTEKGCENIPVATDVPSVRQSAHSEQQDLPKSFHW
jgi:Reverse transcriptase (RNA-dependent DNA polymerase)